MIRFKIIKILATTLDLTKKLTLSTIDNGMINSRAIRRYKKFSKPSLLLVPNA